MGFIDGWRSGGRKQAPPKPPKVKPVIQQKPKPPDKLPLFQDDSDTVRELKSVISDLNDLRLAQAEAFESLVGLVRKHMGRKLDTEIENIRRG